MSLQSLQMADALQASTDKFRLAGNGNIMSAYYSSEELSDCTVATTDGNSIPCHKVVLSSASPVFRAMFTTSGDMSEGSGIVEVKETDPAVVQLLLRHMYGMTAEVPVQQVIGLYKLADQYQVPSATKGLEMLLGGKLSLNSISIMMPAAVELGAIASTIRRQLAIKAAGYAADIATQPSILCAWDCEDVQTLLSDSTVTPWQMLAIAAGWCTSPATDKSEPHTELWSRFTKHVQLQHLSYADLKAAQQLPAIGVLPGLGSALFAECLQRMDKGCHAVDMFLSQLPQPGRLVSHASLLQLIQSFSTRTMYDR